jgi:two-component system OmpR family sensor kinase
VKNRMNFQKRISLFILVLVIFLSALMGFFLIQQTYNQAINLIKNEIRTITTAVAVTPQDKATTALAFTKEATVPISLYLTDNLGTSPILERLPNISEAQVSELALQSNVKNILDLNNLLVGSVELEGSSRLVIIAAKVDAMQARVRSLTTMIILLLGIFIISALGLRFFVARDIKREHELIKRSEQLKIEADQKRILLEFAGDASHELRTPLTVIKGYFELGKKSPAILNNPETISRIISESDRMERTISQLLEVFEIESLPEETFVDFDLSNFLNSKISTFGETNRERELTTSIDDGIRLRANVELFEKILGNLLRNIQVHTQKDDPVRISLTKLKGQIRLIIEDGGPGIAQLEKARLFSRFEKSRSRDKGGSGLGLSIINSAVTKLHGDVLLEPSSLGGLRVELRFASND